MIFRFIRGRKVMPFLAASLLLAAAFAACKKSNKDESAAPVPGIRIMSNAKYGKILTDSAGRTLYFFSNDAGGVSTCTGGCLTAWPLFYRSNPTLDTALKSSDFGTITRADGKPQLTYKGWPLYYYQFDSLAGETKGEGLGNVWFVAKPDYSVMLSRTQLVGKDSVSYDSTYKPGTAKTFYLTDGMGNTLYAFSPDKFKKNTYTKSDFSNDPTWPIYQVNAAGNVPSSFDRTQFDTIHVFGKVQLTYRGWPLYYYGPDNNQRGNTKGVSVPRPGVWPVVNQYSPNATP